MHTDLERKTTQLADSYVAGGISRRTFVTRLLALGLAPSAVGAIVAACGATATPTPAPADERPGYGGAHNGHRGREPESQRHWTSRATCVS